MRTATVLAALAIVLCVGGCGVDWDSYRLGSGDGAAGADLSTAGPLPDLLTTKDGPPPDLAMATDAPPPDLAMPDLTTPLDIAMATDGPPPDMAMTMLTDGPPPDVAMPDMAPFVCVFDNPNSKFDDVCVFAP